MCEALNMWLTCLVLSCWPLELQTPTELFPHLWTTQQPPGPQQPSVLLLLLLLLLTTSYWGACPGQSCITKSRHSLRLGNLKLYRTRSLYCCLSPLWCEWYSDSREVQQQQQQRGCWPTTASHAFQHVNYGESNILRNIFIFIFRLRQTEVCYYWEPHLVYVVIGESVLRHIVNLPPGRGLAYD